MKGKAVRSGQRIDLSEPVVSIPGDAINSLRLELSNLLGKKLAAGVLFRFGYHCGEALAGQHVPDDAPEISISKLLPELWVHTGLGSIVGVQEVSEDEMEVELEDSTEAVFAGTSTEPMCDFTRGYMAGIVNRVMKKKYYCIEASCLSEGAPKCTFQMLVFPHKVYVGKKP
jgi:predicted hydrocarbon binding protein